MPRNVLYYPHMALRDVALVKGMSLYYDNIYRIVPDGEIPDDHPDLQPLIEQGGVGRMVDPSRYAKDAASQFLAGLKHWTADALMADDDESLELAAIHRDKTDRRVRKLFSEAGFAHKGAWTAVPQALASNYMLYLASTVAEKNDLAMVTNDWGAWTASSYFQLDGLVDETISPVGCGDWGPEDASFGVYGLVVNELVPLNIRDIPADDIVVFREKRADEIKAFRLCMQSLAAELSNIEDTEIRADAIRDKAIELERAQSELRASADVLKARGWFGVSMMGFPAPLLFSKIFQIPLKSLTALAGTGLALGGIYSLFATRDELKRLRRNNPASYVMQLQSSFRNYTTVRGGGDANFHAFNCMEEYVAD